MRWKGESEWIWSAEPAHQPLIEREVFEAVQVKMQAAKLDRRSVARSARTAG